MKNDARKKKLLDAPFKDEISKSRGERGIELLKSIWGGHLIYLIRGGKGN